MVKIWWKFEQSGTQRGYITLVIMTVLFLFFIMCIVWWSRCGKNLNSRTQRDNSCNTDHYAPIFYHVHCVMVKVWWWYWSLCPYFLSCALCDGQGVVMALIVMPLFFIMCIVWWSRCGENMNSPTQRDNSCNTDHYAPIFLSCALCGQGVVKIWTKLDTNALLSWYCSLCPYF